MYMIVFIFYGGAGKLFSFYLVFFPFGPCFWLNLHPYSVDGSCLHII